MHPQSTTLYLPDTPGSYYVQQNLKHNRNTIKLLFKRLLKPQKKTKGNSKIDLDKFFSTSYFSKNVSVNSYYGKGELEIGEGSLIMGTFNMEAPTGKIKIGHKSYIGGNTIINSINSVIIGSNVLVAGNCIIQDHDSHSLDYLKRREDIDFAIKRFLGRPNLDKDFSIINSAPVNIEDDAWIGHGCFILKGVTIGRRAIIGAGSVVTKDVPEGGIVVGNPAKLVRVNEQK